MDPRLIPSDILLGVLVAAAALALVQTLRLSSRAFLVRRRLALARQRGALGEARAEELLRRRGFTILGRQVPARYGVDVDGDVLLVDLRADYLVSLRGRRYVAEVKTGTFAPRLETATTRRQLLEYRVAFAVDGVLLVDADAGQVRQVEFPLPRPRLVASTQSRLLWLLAGAACGAALTMVASGELSWPGK